MFLPSIFLPKGLAVCAQTPTKAAEPKRSRVAYHPNHFSRPLRSRRKGAEVSAPLTALTSAKSNARVSVIYLCASAP
jgi:hypothetical protein